MRHIILFFTALVTINAACASTKISNPPDIVLRAYNEGAVQREPLIAELEQAAADASGTENIILRLWLAEQLRLDGQTNAARVVFESILADAKKEPHRQSAQLGLALLAAPRGLDPLTRRQLTDLPANSALPTQNADRYLWLSILSAKQKQSTSQQKYLDKALADAAFDNVVSQRIARHLGSDTPQPAQKMSLLDQIDAALDSGSTEEAKALVEGIELALLTPQEKLAVKYISARIQSGTINLRKIGVLLPLSGRFSSRWKSSQRGSAIRF